MPIATFAPIGQPAHDILCTICREAWDDPVELRPCGHVYCKHCIGTTLPKCPDCRQAIQSRTAPNRILSNMALNVKVECELCHWIGTREESKRHACPMATHSPTTAAQQQEHKKKKRSGFFGWVFGGGDDSPPTQPVPAAAQPAGAQPTPQPQPAPLAHNPAAPQPTTSSRAGRGSHDLLGSPLETAAPTPAGPHFAAAASSFNSHQPQHQSAPSPPAGHGQDRWMYEMFPVFPQLEPGMILDVCRSVGDQSKAYDILANLAGDASRSPPSQTMPASPALPAAPLARQQQPPAHAQPQPVAAALPPAPSRPRCARQGCPAESHNGQMGQLCSLHLQQLQQMQQQQQAQLRQSQAPQQQQQPSHHQAPSPQPQQPSQQQGVRHGAPQPSSASQSTNVFPPPSLFDTVKRPTPPSSAAHSRRPSQDVAPAGPLPARHSQQGHQQPAQPQQPPSAQASPAPPTARSVSKTPQPITATQAAAMALGNAPPPLPGTGIAPFGPSGFSDIVGAGGKPLDSFASYLHEYDKRIEVEKVSRFGAQPSTTTRGDIDKLLEKFATNDFDEPLPVAAASAPMRSHWQPTATQSSAAQLASQPSDSGWNQPIDLESARRNGAAQAENDPAPPAAAAAAAAPAPKPATGNNFDDLLSRFAGDDDDD